MILDKSKVHTSWKPFLTEEIVKELKEIERQIGNDYTPPEDKVLRFMQLDLNEIKVVILGQDPYKPKGVANGRSFQPNDLLNWGQPFRQASLKNIIRNIYTSYHEEIRGYRKIPNYPAIVHEIDSGKFEIKQPKEWFDSLENQGVLFLNTSLTCEIGISNSHKEIWSKFSGELIKFIVNSRPDLVWFIWGKEAQVYLSQVGQSKTYMSRHPMMCSESYEDDFLRNACFRDTKQIINWLG